MKYDLAALSNRKSGFLILNPIEERRTTVRAYEQAMMTMVRGIAAEGRRIKPVKMITDAETGPLRALAALLARVAGNTVSRILRLESIRHTETFMGEARKALGVDLRAIVTQEDLEDYLTRAVERNTSLIRSVSEDMVKRIEQAILDNEVSGRSGEVLRKRLADEFGIVERRARIIARDQTAKLNSDMNSIRQQQAGITEYQWSTSADERVRPLHKRLQGTTYTWGKPTGAEQGLPPGQPILCRCVARAIVTFD